MARQGILRPKVVSTGRLTGSGRGQIHKKKVAGRCVAPLEPAYSLYSTDSEDQVTTIHKGLDRCAALLNGILQSEQAESKPKPQVTKTCSFKSKPKNLSRKSEADKKKHGKMANTGIHANKRPAPVQKTILSAKCHMNLAGRSDQNPGISAAQVSQNHPSRMTHAMQVEHGQQNTHPTCPQPPSSCSLPPSDQVQTLTAFNCRLTTSTPALSPQRPGSAHSEPCTSKCVLSSGHSSMRSMNAAAPSCAHGSAEMSATPNQFAASVSMPPIVQRQSPVTVFPVQNGSCFPVEHEAPVITSPVCSVPHVGSMGPNVLLGSSIGAFICPSSSLQETQVPNQPQVIQANPNGPELMICNGQKQESLTENGIGAEDEKDGMDTTPVRDTSFQTSTEKLSALNHKTKTCSPEKTAQRVMTVKYLLGELKALVANQDIDAVRLISEVEQSIALLPVMVGSTNIQAEIALALQPLRSENVQLRRRLRILNQQLLGRERAERRARPESCEMEVVALQSLNLSLQTQLNDSRREFDDLQQENMRLRKAVEDKDSDLKHCKDLCELENSRLRLEVNEALAEIQSCQSKLKDYEIEKTELTLSLQQRETEISKLQEVIRSLQRSQTEDTSRYSPQMDVCHPNSHLTKTVLELHENAQKEAPISDKLSNSVKTYLQTLEDIGRVSPPNHNQCRPQALQPAFSGQTSSAKISSPYKHKPTLETIAENVTQLDEQKRTMFVPLRETPMVQISSGLAESTSITGKSQRKDVDVLKYMGLAFQNLDISEGLLIQDATNDVRDRFSDDHGVALHLIHKNKGLSSQSVQTQHAHRGLRMGVQSTHNGRPSMDNTFSSCDIKSLASDWSVNTCSTFNTQDEQNFRDGLAALDASIESLQKTLNIDRNK